MQVKTPLITSSKSELGSGQPHYENTSATPENTVSPPGSHENNQNSPPPAASNNQNLPVPPTLEELEKIQKIGENHLENQNFRSNDE